MQYRTHPDGPLTTITVALGCICVRLDYDLPGTFTRLHSHAFEHSMLCVAGSARVELDGQATIVRAGERYQVAAHRQHGVWPLERATVLLCEHLHADIDPAKQDGDGIPLEWLRRLTDVPADELAGLPA